MLLYMFFIYKSSACFFYKYGNFTLDIATAIMMLANILHNSLPLTTITGSVSSIYTNKQVWCHIKLRDRYFEFICLDIDCESVLDGVAVALTYVDAAELLQGISEVRQSNESNNRS